MAYIKIEVEGNVGKDPEMRYTANGIAVTSFSLAHGKSKPDGSGGWTDLGTDWFNVTVWREAGERAAEWIRKGQRLLVIGKFERREYERQDGTMGSSLDITADTILPLGKRTDGGTDHIVEAAEQSAYAPREARAAAPTGDDPGPDEPNDLDDLPF